MKKIFFVMALLVISVLPVFSQAERRAERTYRLVSYYINGVDYTWTYQDRVDCWDTLSATTHLRLTNLDTSLGIDEYSWVLYPESWAVPVRKGFFDVVLCFTTPYAKFFTGEVTRIRTMQTTEYRFEIKNTNGSIDRITIIHDYNGGGLLQ
jgi:hypothetical protein